MNFGIYELFSQSPWVFIYVICLGFYELCSKTNSQRKLWKISSFFLQYIDFFKNLNRYNSDVIIIILWFLYRHNRKIKIRKNLYCINAFLCKPKAFLSLLIVSGLSFNLRIMIFSSATTKISREKFWNNHLTLK